MTLRCYTCGTEADALGQFPCRCGLDPFRSHGFNITVNEGTPLGATPIMIRRKNGDTQSLDDVLRELDELRAFRRVAAASRVRLVVSQEDAEKFVAAGGLDQRPGTLMAMPRDDKPRPIAALLEGPPGLYACGDTTHPESLVPIYKSTIGKCWSMSLDEILRPDGWQPTAVVYSGPHTPPSWVKA